MAPEVLQSKKEGYSAKIDIWSLGCVVLEMFAGKRPWSTEEAIGAMFKVSSPGLLTSAWERKEASAHS
jgi:mitogen-activated protein kinase kinase kinase